MKTNKKFLTILTLLTLCIALLLTACGATDAADTDKNNESLTETGTVSTDSSNTALDDLYQQENQLFADHEAVWNKVFGMMSKGKGTLSHTLPAVTKASICPKEESQIRFSALISVWL